MKRQLLVVVILILVINIAGLVLHTKLKGLPRAPLAFCVIASAVITFFWFLVDWRVGSSNYTIEDDVMRRAIAGSMVVAYLVLTGIAAFWEGGSSTLAPLAQTMITSFTYLIGVVIAFYFGSSAYAEAQKRTQDKAGSIPENSKHSSDQPGATGDAR